MDKPNAKAMSQPEILTELTRRLAQPDFKSEFMACARDDYALQVLEPLPTDIQVGVATADTCELYSRTSFFDYPPGMCCLRCYTGQPFLSSYVDKVTGKCSNYCESCCQKRFSMFVNDASPWQFHDFVSPPLTSSPVNLIVTITRYSRKGHMKKESNEILVDFITTWSDFPLLSTHVPFVIGNFAAIGSGLALYKQMNRRMTVKSKEPTNLKERPETVNKLLFYIRSCCRTGQDAVTLVSYTMSTFAVKPSNYVVLMKDFAEAGISAGDVNFVCYGQQTHSASTAFKPISRTGSQILHDIETRNENSEWLHVLRIECISRVFINGLGSGRNRARPNDAIDDMPTISEESE